MTKTKAQLRVEAVERLKRSEYHTALDDVCSMLGWGHEPHFEGATDALIDLLTDDDSHEERESYEERMYDVPVSDCPYCGCARVVIHDYNDSYERPHSYRVEHVSEKEAFNEGCFTSYYAFDSVEKAVQHADERNEWRCIGECADANDTLAAENDVSEASVNANAGNADTREKLEADACTFVARAWEAGRNFEHRDLNTRSEDVTWSSDELIDLLDRQAAITERELCRQCSWPSLAAMPDKEAYDRIGELQSKVDVLEIENSELCDEIAALDELRGELTRERDGYHEEKVRLEMELAQAQGLLSNVTHNHAAAKAKYERAQIDAKRARERQEEAERKYDELLKKPPEGAWAERVAELEAERDEFRDRLGKVLDLAGEIGGLA